MKKIAKYLGLFFIIGVACSVLENTDGVMELAGWLIVALLAYVVIVDTLFGKRKKSSAAPRQARPAKRKSFRSRVVTSASDSVARGITNILIPRGPTPEEQARARDRAEAEKQYWFYQKRADAYRGTPEGDRCQQQAWYYQSKMK